MAVRCTSRELFKRTAEQADRGELQGELLDRRERTYRQKQK